MATTPLADTAEDSTLPFDDELPEESPGMEEDETPEQTAPPISLTIDQASNAGIIDAKPGDTFTLKVSITGTGEGITGSILPGSAMKDEAPAAGPADRAGLQKIKGPKDMGFGDETDSFSQF